jgi:hypothetical protein
MLKQVIIAENALEPETWSGHYVENISDFLMERYDTFPENARIYHKSVSLDNDVTPTNEAQIETLNQLEDILYVVNYPTGGLLVPVIVAIVSVALSVAISFLLKPPSPTQRNTQTESPNNGLSDRENNARILARIPDIFGKVRSTPDLLNVPYKEFIDHQEVEYAYMCVGRGYYDITADNVKDGDTKISDISGASVAIYPPDTSPNNGSPQLTIGSAINEPVLKSVRSNAANGQTLKAPDAAAFNGNNNTRFIYPNQIETTATGIDFTEEFTAGSTITIASATYTATVGTQGSQLSRTVKCAGGNDGTITYITGDPSSDFNVGDSIRLGFALFTTDGGGTLNLNGDYVIKTLTSTTITLDNPAAINSNWNEIENEFSANETGSKSVFLTFLGAVISVNLNGNYTIASRTTTSIYLTSPSSVNSDWNKLDDYDNNRTGLISPYLYSTGEAFVGWFNLLVDDLDKIYINLVALQGLYKDDGEQQYAFNIAVQVQVEQTSATGTPTGTVETFTGTVLGSSSSKSTRALTMKINPTFTGYCRVRVKRTTNSDTNFEGTVVDEVKWRDLYAMSPVSQNDFGDVTTVQSVTYATDGALAVKSRKLNMEVTRKLPKLQYERYTFPMTWTSHSNGLVKVAGNNVTISSDGSSYGGYADLDAISNGQVITVTLTLDNTKTTATTVTIGLHDGTSFISNTATVTNGTATYTLTATSAEANPFVLLQCGNNDTYFTVTDMQVSGEDYPSTQTISADSYYGGVITYQYGGVKVANDGGSYGISTPIEYGNTGYKTIVDFDLLSASTSTSVSVVILDNANQPMSNVETVSAGARSVTLTHTAKTAGRVVIYSTQSSTFFALRNLKIKAQELGVSRYATTDAAQILTNICVDPFIGRRPLTEVDLESVLSTAESVTDYFGTTKASEFNYTFDADNLSFEETAQTIATAIYSQAYRQGSKIKLSFEKETDDSVLLFNHRNKLPQSETRSVRFGNASNHDGIEFVYASPVDDALISINIPSDQSATNPDKIESVGVRNGVQAYFAAHRAWNKIQYQNTLVDFEATQEADLLVTNDRILVADNTRTGTQDGEVTAVNVLELTLSQDVTFAGGGVTYTIFLQHVDGTVESIGITAGTADNKVILANAPRLSLITDQNKYARTGYNIVASNAARGTAFLVTEKQPNDNFTSRVGAVNYSDKYYTQDNDYLTGVVDIDGDEI